MNATAKLWAFLAAFLVGSFATAYKYHGATIDAYLHTSHLHVQDWLLLMFGSLGTPQNLAVRPYLNERKIPQLFIASGDEQWSHPKSFPWTPEATSDRPIRHAGTIPLNREALDNTTDSFRSQETAIVGAIPTSRMHL